MEKLINILKSKWLTKTSRTAIIICIIIIIFLGMNVIIKNINPDNIDLTEESLYSLSDESKEIIKNLPEEDKIQLYMFDINENNPIAEMVEQYAKENENITLEVIKEADDRPDLVSKYNIEAGYGTVVIDSGKKQKIFTSYDFYTQDYSTGKSVDITEQRITNGIVAVSSIGTTTPIYVLSGHNEYNITTQMIYLNTYLSLENYEAKSLDLLSAQNVPEDCKVLIIASPQKDITDLEEKAIKAYIEKGGNILWMSDPYSGETEMPRFNEILAMYGVNVRQDGFILEQDTSKMVMGTPAFIYTDIQSSSVTSGLSTVLMLDTGKLEFVEDLEALNVTKTDLLKTSKKSFFRTNIQNTSTSPAEGETEGENVVGAMLTKKLGEEDDAKTSTLIAYANAVFATDKAIYAGNSPLPMSSLYDNKDLALNTIKELAEVEDAIAIRKQIETTYYTATETQDRIIKIIIFGLPVIIILAGIVVWQLRRRKK